MSAILIIFETITFSNVDELLVMDYESFLAEMWVISILKNVSAEILSILWLNIDLIEVIWPISGIGGSQMRGSVAKCNKRHLKDKSFTASQTTLRGLGEWNSVIFLKPVHLHYRSEFIKEVQATNWYFIVGIKYLYDYITFIIDAIFTTMFPVNQKFGFIQETY